MSSEHLTAQPSGGVTSAELLRGREELWSTRLRGYSLVAELQVKESHSTQVAAVLGQIYGRWAGTPRADAIFSRWPACVVVAVTGIAARHYEHGGLWPRLWVELRYDGDQNDQVVWGRGFKDALIKLGLPTFPDLPLHYLGPILMHTGIPDYCLQDYFCLLGQRRAADPDLDPEGFFNWATAAPSRLNTLDKPARRFLEYGSEYALDFVDRTFDLLDRVREPVPDLDGVGLPARVMTRAQELAAAGVLNLRPPRPSATVQRRAGRPRISLDPFGRGIEVILPAVSDAPDGIAKWSLFADGVIHTVQSQAQWAGVTEAAPSTAFTLLKPVRSVVVTTEGGTHQIELPVVDSNAPMLVFADDGRRLPSNVPLPPDVVWVAHPDEYALCADGSLRVTIEGQLPLGWNGWRLRQVDLADVRSLELAGLPSTRRTVRGYARPRIVVDTPLPGITTPYGTAVHTKLPDIWLPGTAGARTDWTVEVRPSGDGKTATTKTYQVDEARTVTDLWDESARPLLGSFNITVRGPLGRAATRTLFLAEGLGVRFTPQVRVFGPEGLGGARAELTPAIGAQAIPRLLDFDSTLLAAVFEYRTEHETEPLVLTPPHVQVMHERADETLAWSAGPLRISVDAFDNEPGTLLVRVPGAASIPALQVIVRGRVVQEIPPSGRTQNGTARFDLVRAADTVAEHQQADLVLDLRGPVRVAAVRPRRLAEAVRRTGDDLQLVGFLAVEGLTGGVYASTAPWRGPWVVPIGEDGILLIPAELQNAGPLLVSLRVDDPWVPFEWPPWPDRYLFVGGDGHLNGEDGEETALSRFLAGQGEFPEHVTDLRRLWVLTRLAHRLCVSSEAPRLVATCAEPICSHPREAVASLAALGFEPDETVAAVVSSGLAATVTPDPSGADPARRLWPVAPLLALFSGTLTDTACFEAGEVQCGETIPKIAASGVDPYAAIGRFGPEVTRMIHMQPQQIESIWRAAEIVPQALLDPDTRAAAARRLFDHREDGNIRKFGRTAESITQGALRLLACRPRLRAQIEARMPDIGKGGWYSVPAASAACATIARLAARGHEQCRNAERSFRPDWARLATGAPDLVTIDLILAELLICFEKAATR